MRCKPRRSGSTASGCLTKAFATMACLCPDRVVLGLGAGEALNETTVTGARWPDFKRPVRSSYFDVGLNQLVFHGPVP